MAAILIAFGIVAALVVVAIAQSHRNARLLRERQETLAALRQIEEAERYRWEDDEAA